MTKQEYQQPNLDTITILIVNWNSKDYVSSCLKSLGLSILPLEFQIIVVDGGSFDGCGQMLAQEFPQVDFIQSPENVGFAQANNLGFKHAKGKILILLNPDTEISSSEIRELATQLRKQPQAGMVAPCLLNTNGTLQTSCVQALPTPLNRSLDSEFLHRLFPKSELWKKSKAFSSQGPVTVEAVSGACMVLESEMFRQVGGFTPAYFMYAEDMDLCYKIKRSGKGIYHIPHVKIIHHGGGSTAAQFSSFKAIAMQDALHKYMRLNHGNKSAALYKTFMAMSAVIRIPLLLACYPFVESRRNILKSRIRRWSTILQWTLLNNDSGKIEHHTLK